MQLKRKPRKIRKALALATTTMLTGTSSIANAEVIDDSWLIESSILYYTEKDRVTAIEPVIYVRKELADEEFLGVRFVFDSLTGATPNGAIKQPFPQTFTSESGNGTYTAAANETPLDSAFRDARGAVNIAWEKPMSDRSKGIYGFNFSKEYDYTSMGLSATFSWDSSQRLRTWTAGVSYNFENTNPIGGIPEAFSTVPTTAGGPKTIIGDNDDKTVADILFGITQVLNRKTVMQFNFNFGMDDGYLTDPYKMLSELDANGNLTARKYIYENRPDSRTRQALYWKTVHSFGEDVVHVSYRYYWDDWGIDSHTIDAKYRYELGGGHYLQPHLRYYLQSKADFYYYNLREGNTPSYASADYRLADLSTTTIGLKYGVEMSTTSEFTIRAEMMTQQSEDGDAPFDDVEAIIFQLGYSIFF